RHPPAPRAPPRPPGPPRRRLPPHLAHQAWRVRPESPPPAQAALRDADHRALPPPRVLRGGGPHRDVPGRRLRPPCRGHHGGPVGYEGQPEHGQRAEPDGLRPHRGVAEPPRRGRAPLRLPRRHLAETDLGRRGPQRGGPGGRRGERRWPPRDAGGDGRRQGGRGQLAGLPPPPEGAGAEGRAAGDLRQVPGPRGGAERVLAGSPMAEVHCPLLSECLHGGAVRAGEGGGGDAEGDPRPGRPGGGTSQGVCRRGEAGGDEVGQGRGRAAGGGGGDADVQGVPAGGGVPRTDEQRPGAYHEGGPPADARGGGVPGWAIGPDAGRGPPPTHRGDEVGDAALPGHDPAESPRGGGRAARGGRGDVAAAGGGEPRRSARARTQSSSKCASFRTLPKELGLDPSVTVHSFRVTALTVARERGADIVGLQDFAGHADPRTTLTYIRNRDRLSDSPAYLLKY